MEEEDDAAERGGVGWREAREGAGGEARQAGGQAMRGVDASGEGDEEGDEREVGVEGGDGAEEASKGQVMQVTVPEGLSGGHPLRVQTHVGLLEVVIPDGTLTTVAVRPPGGNRACNRARLPRGKEKRAPISADAHALSLSFSFPPLLHSLPVSEKTPCRALFLQSPSPLPPPPLLFFL